MLIPAVGLVTALAAAFALTSESGPLSIIDTGASVGCSVSYTVSSQWNTGFTAGLTITNVGSPIAINPLMSWLDSEHASYLAWAWNTDSTAPAAPA